MSLPLGHRDSHIFTARRSCSSLLALEGPVVPSRQASVLFSHYFLCWDVANVRPSGDSSCRGSNKCEKKVQKGEGGAESRERIGQELYCTGSSMKLKIVGKIQAAH